MFLSLFVFLLTTVFYGFVLWLVCRRITRHLQENPEGVKALAAAMVPLFGRKADEQLVEKPVDETVEAPAVPAPFAPTEAELAANGKAKKKQAI